MPLYFMSRPLPTAHLGEFAWFYLLAFAELSVDSPAFTPKAHRPGPPRPDRHLNRTAVEGSSIPCATYHFTLGIQVRPPGIQQPLEGDMSNITTLHTNDTSDQIDPFSIAHSAWLAAHAKWMDCNQTEDEMEAAASAVAEAVWALIRTPADRQCDVLEKARFVQHLVNQTADMGEPRDHHHVAALASLVADIARLHLERGAA